MAEVADLSKNKIQNAFTDCHLTNVTLLPEKMAELTFKSQAVADAVFGEFNNKRMLNSDRRFKLQNSLPKIIIKGIRSDIDPKLLDADVRKTFKDSKIIKVVKDSRNQKNAAFNSISVYFASRQDRDNLLKQGLIQVGKNFHMTVNGDHTAPIHETLFIDQNHELVRSSERNALRIIIRASKLLDMVDLNHKSLE